MAQACCAGGAAYQPARLKLHEDWLVGISLQASDELGYSDQHGVYSARSSSGEQDFIENVLGTVRVFDRGQVGISVPFDESNRYAQSLHQFGGSIGDISLTGRWDFLYSNESAHFPGISLLAGVTLPTGIPAESSALPLGANTTGLGAWQVAGGLSLERTFIDRIVVNATALVTQSFERHVLGVEEQLGTQFSGLFAAGWIFRNEAAIALTFTYSDSLDARLNGVAQPDSEIQINTLGIAGGIPLTDEWRIQATAFWDLPPLGRNHIDSIGGSVTVIRAFL
jgi:hypothetical protein